MRYKGYELRVCSQRFGLAQLSAVALADLLVPEEGVLAVALHLLEVELVAVHVDEAVALGDALVRGDEVKGAPGAVAHKVDAVGYGQLAGLDVLAQVIDAVVVVDARLAVLPHQLVTHAAAVLGDEQRQLVALPQLTQLSSGSW